jgi:hypothetical protein
VQGHKKRRKSNDNMQQISQAQAKTGINKTKMIANLCFILYNTKVSPQE